jgi:hypothetical protein
LEPWTVLTFLFSLRTIKREIWRDRDGNLTQNVLAICNFDMEFTDLLCGWSGSTADSTLWIEAVRAGAVSIPRGKYVLGSQITILSCLHTEEPDIIRRRAQEQGIIFESEREPEPVLRETLLLKLCGKTM